MRLVRSWGILQASSKVGAFKMLPFVSVIGEVEDFVFNEPRDVHLVLRFEPEDLL